MGDTVAKLTRAHAVGRLLTLVEDIHFIGCLGANLISRLSASKRLNQPTAITCRLRDTKQNASSALPMFSWNPKNRPRI
jgi:hypothetical protein